MVGHRGTTGENPLRAVNVETLISAVRVLQDREGHEVAPFVAAWASSLSNFGSGKPSNAPGEKILKAIGDAFEGRGAFADTEISEAVATAARAAVKPDLRAPFVAAETFVLKSLVNVLSDIDDVGYLQPLVDLARKQGDGLDIVTLNYDLSVETIAEQNEVEVQRGIDRWQPGQLLDFPSLKNTINLMKLHGSLDWRRRQGSGWEASPLDPISIVLDKEADEVRNGEEQLPWIVVGDREKLATDGPTLMLNYAARKAFARSTHLAVVGYSFGDAHINAIIRDWMASDEVRTMSVLEHSWPWDPNPENRTDFRSALLDAYARRRKIGPNRECVDPRMVALEGRAKDRLAEALVARPQKLPEVLVAAAATTVDGGTRIDLTWLGNDLKDAQISAGPVENKSFGGQIIKVLNSSADLHGSIPEYQRPWRVTKEVLNSGDATSVYLNPDVIFPIVISINGISITGYQGDSVTIAQVS